MKYLISLVLIFLTSPLSATYIFFNADELNEREKTELFNLVMEAEPPRAFYQSHTIDFNQACRELYPSLELQWITPTSWQIAALHAFFQYAEIKNAILACAKSGLDPLSYDAELHEQLAHAENLEEIAAFFDAKSQSLPTEKLFFDLNRVICKLYERGERDETAMIKLALAELPPFSSWREKEFPFWRSPWIYNLDSAEIFYRAIMDENLIHTILQIEHIAHEQGEWVLYRGYSGSGPPTSLQTEGVGSHALSFGSTLLGGVFFSLEATALTYAYPHIDQGDWSFLVLRVTSQDLREVFRIGPLHPFIQLLVDGEMFHAHTKVAADKPDDYVVRPLHGYFMACNRHCTDPCGYILGLHMQPEELEKKFQTLCTKSGTIFVQAVEKTR